MPQAHRFTVLGNVPDEPGTGLAVRIGEKLRLVAEARGIELRLLDLRTRLAEIQALTLLREREHGSGDEWTKRTPRATPPAATILRCAPIDSRPRSSPRHATPSYRGSSED